MHGLRCMREFPTLKAVIDEAGADRYPEDKSNRRQNMEVSKHARYRSAQPFSTVVFVMLMCQNAANILLQHKLQTRKVDSSLRYEPLSAIVLSETLKVFISLIGFGCAKSALKPSANFFRSIQSGHKNLALPAALYTLSTTSQSLGAYHLDVMSFLMLSQLKLILTPIFSRLLMKQTLHPRQWLYLILMALGMALVQIDSTARYSLSRGDDKLGQNSVFGVVAMLGAGGCSAFGSVYMEAALKVSEHGFLIRNAQLALYSCLCATGGFLWKSNFTVVGFFCGYTILVWSSIILQAIGGFLVSWVVCASNTMLKNYAQSLGFLAASTIPLITSPRLLTPELCCGTILVLTGVFSALWKTEMLLNASESYDESGGNSEDRLHHHTFPSMPPRYATSLLPPV